MRDLAVPADQLFDDLTRQHRDAGAPAARRRPRLLRGPPEPALQLRRCTPRSAAPTPGSRHVHRKVFLPTYGVFDEERFVEAGRSVQAFDTRWGRAAILICEDAWHSFTPMLAALDGAQLIIIPSASPARGVVASEEPAGCPASLAPVGPDRAGHGRRARSVRRAARSWWGSRAGRRFPAARMVAGPRGDLLAEAPVFDEALHAGDLDFEEITRARADLPLLADLEMRLPHLLGSLHDAQAREAGRRRRGEAGRATDSEAGRASQPRRADRGPSAPRPAPALHPPVPPDADPLAIDPELTRRWLVEFIRDEVQRRRGFERVVDRPLGRGGQLAGGLPGGGGARDRRTCSAIRMPYRTSSPESLAHAQLVIDALGIPSTNGGHQRRRWTSGSRPSAETSTPGRLGNIMARTRMITLFDLSAAHARAPAGHRQQDRAAVRLLHLARRRLAAGQSHRRPVQDPGLGAGPAPRRARRDRLQAGERRPDQGADGRGRLRDHLSAGRRDPALDSAGLPPAGDRRAGLRGGGDRPGPQRLDSTHWKRRLPTVAMLSATAIGEYYLRPVDY